MAFTPTADQARAFEVIGNIAGRPPGRFVETCVVQGCAGTGKTTLIREVVAAFGDSTILAPTGKAALRIKEATGYAASTIHRWLYKAVQNPDTGEVTFEMKRPEELRRSDSGIVIVDEASMVNAELHDAIIIMCEALGMNVLFLGDHGQLGPVETKGGPTFNILDAKSYNPTYRVELKEIVRQAAGDPIIETATLLRSKKLSDITKAMIRLPCFPQSRLITEALETTSRGGVVICWKNETRHKLNREIRAALWSSEILEPKEPIVVQKNCYPANVFNGEVLQFLGWQQEPNHRYEVVNRYRDPPDNTQACRFGRGTIQASDGQEYRVVMCHEEIMGALNEKISPSAVGACARRFWGRKDPVVHANLGYVLTCHKSQGSEWPEVLVVLDGINTADPEHRRWLYTAVTRSKKTVRVCIYGDY